MLLMLLRQGSPYLARFQWEPLREWEETTTWTSALLAFVSLPEHRVKCVQRY